ncbi:hypothetical protein [Streptomyces sp. NPDC051218]|uniref:hypothetical protein n=1 Tax=Streptomyces sp. NPDC051218 TaxID=3365645 RepID=UPI0037BAD6EA
MELIGELGLRTYPTYNEGEHIWEFGATRCPYTGRIPKVNPERVTYTLQLRPLTPESRLMPRQWRCLPVELCL